MQSIAKMKAATEMCHIFMPAMEFFTFSGRSKSSGDAKMNAEASANAGAIGRM
ncbi:hypothetical protein SDC9_207676 [bioreactor metagenome]|uniref:Uncharacterized protein n=1 Tax=bioreactor metagenome TaxID=1076179 RepID=A0A645JJZ6_9ZZZZ